MKAKIIQHGQEFVADNVERVEFGDVILIDHSGIVNRLDQGKTVIFSDEIGQPIISAENALRGAEAEVVELREQLAQEQTTVRAKDTKIAELLADDRELREHYKTVSKMESTANRQKNEARQALESANERHDGEMRKMTEALEAANNEIARMLLHVKHRDGEINAVKEDRQRFQDQANRTVQALTTTQIELAEQIETLERVIEEREAWRLRTIAAEKKTDDLYGEMRRKVAGAGIRAKSAEDALDERDRILNKLEKKIKRLKKRRTVYNSVTNIYGEVPIVDEAVQVEAPKDPGPSVIGPKVNDRDALDI